MSSVGLPQVVQYSLNMTGMSRSTGDMRGCCALTSRSVTSSSERPVATTARGVSNLPPGAIFFDQWPNSRSASPPQTVSGSAWRMTSICQLDAQYSCTPMNSPVELSSSATNGNHLRTGIEPI